MDGQLPHLVMAKFGLQYNQKYNTFSLKHTDLFILQNQLHISANT